MNSFRSLPQLLFSEDRTSIVTEGAAARTIGMRFDQTGPQATNQPRQDTSKACDPVAQASLDWAIQHPAERESVIPLADLLQNAVRHAGDHTDVTAIQSAIQARAHDIGGLHHGLAHDDATQTLSDASTYTQVFELQ